MMSTPRCLILTEIIAPYRIPPFNLLAAWPGIDLEVLFLSQTESRRSWTVPLADIRFRYEVLPGLRVGSLYQGGPVFLNPGVARALTRRSPHVVVIGGWHHPSYWLAVRAARRSGARVLLWSESTAADARRTHFLKEWVKRWVLANVDGCIVPGNAQRAYLTSLGAREDAIWLAPNAVDVQHFASVADSGPRLRTRAELGLRQRTVLYVGRMRDEKGVLDLLEAARRLPHLDFLMVGDGPRMSHYRKWSSSTGIDNIKWAGFQEQRDLPAFYAAADLFVFPTHSDPWGLVVNEAIAAGLPVICSAAAGCANEVVIEGANGYIVQPHNVVELCERIAQIAGDDVLRSRMSAAAIAWAARFTPYEMAGGFADAFAAVLAGAATPRRAATNLFRLTDAAG